MTNAHPQFAEIAHMVPHFFNLNDCSFDEIVIMRHHFFAQLTPAAAFQGLPSVYSRRYSFGEYVFYMKVIVKMSFCNLQDVRNNPGLFEFAHEINSQDTVAIKLVIRFSMKHFGRANDHVGPALNYGPANEVFALVAQTPESDSLLHAFNCSIEKIIAVAVI